MSDRHQSRSGPPTPSSTKPEHPHGGPPGQTGQNPGQSGSAPPGQANKPPEAEPKEAEPASTPTPGPTVYIPPRNPEYDALERERAHATQQARPVTTNNPPDEEAANRGLPPGA